MINKFIKNKKCKVGLIIILAIIIFGVIYPIVSPNDPYAVSSADKYIVSSTRFPLGTDSFGRCVLTRIAVGTKYSLLVSFVIIGAISVISLLIGTIPAYYGGKYDRAFVAVCDVIMAFPQMIFVLVLIGILGKGIGNLMISMIISQWAWYAKFVRGYVLEEKNKGYVKAAIASGTKSYKIILRHIIPNILPAFIVYVSVGMGRVILELSAFSFLGLGVSPEIPEWGAMLNENRKCIFTHPELMLYPGLFIFFTAMAFNLLGDGLRDIFDHRKEGVNESVCN
ncbi:glutathione ABC transporter permease GsiD [Vallitalea longa]|uniref:Glutathione ABC transporter permease GsiD n=1 Tax=Vallitalea longa TaxID=2936439 RepID=A0A9W5Y722_9FIRM|nr:ABC transporter permease [Vallitalea longa]GKX27592.1 glutathione ABC transporter permease GsiD [Vallitalea longa]